jgi:hypothetical protein
MLVDVPTQKEAPNWRLKAWADYYDTPADQRDRVRNVMYPHDPPLPISQPPDVYVPRSDGS